MKLKELKRPTYSFNPDFSMARKSNPDSFTFTCEVCNTLLKINFQKQIDSSWLGKTDEVNDEELKELKRFYNIGLSHKSHEGGLPVFEKIKCPKCKTNYLAYSGVTEFSNSAYAVQIQGITREEKENLE